MTVLDNYIILQHEGELGKGDVIRGVVVEEIPSIFPGVLKKQNYYESKAWLDHSEHLQQEIDNLKQELEKLEHIQKIMGKGIQYEL